VSRDGGYVASPLVLLRRVGSYAGGVCSKTRRAGRGGGYVALPIVLLRRVGSYAGGVCSNTRRAEEVAT